MASLSLIATVHAAAVGYCKLLVVVEWLAGRTATLAMQASFAQQCVHQAVDPNCENSTPTNAVTISDKYNCAISTG